MQGEFRCKFVLALANAVLIGLIIDCGGDRGRKCFGWCTFFVLMALYRSLSAVKFAEAYSGRCRCSVALG